MREAQPVLEIVGDPELVPFEGKAACRVSFRVKHALGSLKTQVAAEGRIAVYDGSIFETEAPEASESPKILAWQVEGGLARRGSPVLEVTGSSDTIYRVTVSVPDNAAVGVFLDAKKAIAP
jgi:hypothetical protein